MFTVLDAGLTTSLSKDTRGPFAHFLYSLCNSEAETIVDLLLKFQNNPKDSRVNQDMLKNDVQEVGCVKRAVRAGGAGGRGVCVVCVCVSEGGRMGGCVGERVGGWVGRAAARRDTRKGEGGQGSAGKGWKRRESTKGYGGIPVSVNILLFLFFVRVTFVCYLFSVFCGCHNF